MQYAIIDHFQPTAESVAETAGPKNLSPMVAVGGQNGQGSGADRRLRWNRILLV